MPVNKLDNEIIIRTMVGLMIGPIFLGAIIFSKTLLKILILIVTIGMLIEWYDMTKEKISYLVAGLAIISLPISCLISIIYMFDDYKYAIFTYSVIVVSMDVFAMFGGRFIGGPKLVPKISPGKTWAGLVSGTLACMIIAHLISYLPEYEFVYSGWSLVFFAAILGLFGQASDIFISFFKRRFNLKDTGKILPGHGGLLDRFDSLIFSAPLMLYILL